MDVKQYERVPAELRALKQWVVRKGKVPYQPTGYPAKPDTPATWCSFEQATTALKGGSYDGVGFVFNHNGIVGVDLDHVVDPVTAQLKPWAQDVVNHLNSYTEYSPSGTGLHIFVKGDIPVDGKKRQIDKVTNEAVEFYKAKRYFTVTGNVYLERPIEECAAELQRVYEKVFPPEQKPAAPRPAPSTASSDTLAVGLERDKVLAELWNGRRNTSDESSNDIALMNKLAYWCDCDGERMVAAFLSSPYATQKDDEHTKKMNRKDYLPRTAAEAINGCARTASQDSAIYQESRRQSAYEDFKDVATPTKKLKVKRMSEITAKRPKHILYPYLPEGKLSIVGGVSGSTKTWFVLYVASVISTGGDFITDMPFTPKRTPGVVIYQTKENDYESDIRPRLDALGANLDNILVIDDKDEDDNGIPLTLSDGRIEEAIKEYNAKMVVFDPLQSYLGDDVDMHRANEVRPILDKIIDIGNRYNCTIVIVSHMSKMTTAAALDRLLGSSDLRNAARSIMIIGSDPEDDKVRVLAHAKNSLGVAGQSIKYHIDTENGGVVIDGFCDYDADEIVQSMKRSGRGKASMSLDGAVSFLSYYLSEKGYAEKSDILDAAKEAGISERTLYNSKKELGVKSLSLGYGVNKKSWWLNEGINESDLQQTREAE